MPEYSLISAPPLAGTDLKFGTCRVVAPADLAIVSFALPLGGEGPAKTALKSAYGVAVPEVGQSALSRDGSARLARVSSEQGFVIFAHATPDAEKTVSTAIKGRAYTTDQTDVWCGLEVSGPDCRVGRGLCLFAQCLGPVSLQDIRWQARDAIRSGCRYASAGF